MSTVGLVHRLIVIAWYCVTLFHSKCMNIYNVDLMWCYKVLFGIVEIQAQDFLCPVRMLQLEVTSTNYSRSPIFHGTGKLFQ